MMYMLIYIYLSLALNLCLGKILKMGRAKHEHLWIHVTEVENGRKWLCKHCNVKFSGGAIRLLLYLISNNYI
jgi:hypothetical protein